MRVEIWSDVVCPWCFIGKRRFEKALANFAHRDKVEVTWRSFELDPDAPVSLGMSLDEMLARKYGMSPEEARAANARVSKLAAEEGLSWRLEIARPGNSFAAHRLVHAARAAGGETLAAAVNERFMRGYFGEGLAVGDPEALVAAAAEAGLDAAAARRALAGDDHAQAVRDDEERAAGFGVSGVPFFAIEEKWGISGAQPLEVFTRALETSWAETERAGAGRG
jgi:predicted DsbA family dithiol-disulfide isomerase